MFFLITFFAVTTGYAQKNEPKDSTKSTALEKFNTFNQKAENLFKILPFPMVTYAPETGTVFGLVKYNLVDIVPSDTISSPSSFSELISFSTLKQFKVVLGTKQYFLQNKIILTSEAQYVDYPDFILGVGNDVSRENVEQITTKRVVFNNAAYFSIVEDRSLYAGMIFNYTNYLSVEFDSNSVFLKEKYPGYKGGVSSGIGLGLIYDTRDHRYNASEGMYIESNIINYGGLLGSDYDYYGYIFDIRKYWNPWYKHVIAVQLFAEGNVGKTPFYSLGRMGGSERMRGYYYGAIRDKMIMDAQLEYRMHIWNIFGVVAFASAGRVAENWRQYDFKGLWYAGGFGLRIMVDQVNKANLRIDVGYGQNGASTLVLGFTEAF